MPITRREFVVFSAASAFSAVSVASQPAGKPWHQRIRRWGQLNLNETDPRDLNVRQWVDYWAGLPVDGVTFNAGGILAFYPTQVPYHHRSEFLGDRDLFGELVAEARRRGLRVIARLDPNQAYEECYRAHPDWFRTTRDDRPVRHSESTWLYQTCMYGPYFAEQIPAIIREVNGRYDIDGYFTNGWPGPGGPQLCYCPHCREMFRSRAGADVPAELRPGDPLTRKFAEFHLERVVEIWRLWDRLAREKNPDNLYFGNLGGSIFARLNLKRIGETTQWLMADHQGRSGATPLWDAGQQGRICFSVMRGRTSTNAIASYSGGTPVWRHTAKPAAEARLWLAQAVASGMAPWWHWLGGSPEDLRWRQTGRDFYSWLARHSAHFANRRSLASVGLVWPQRTFSWHRWEQLRGADRNQLLDHFQGFYYALLQGRIPFDIVLEDDLGPERLRQYRALILPNLALVSDEQARLLRAYVERGGSLVATFETSLFNEWGDRRNDFALADLFGVSYEGPEEPQRNSYARIAPGSRHPIVSGFDTPILPGATALLGVRPRPLTPGSPARPVFGRDGVAAPGTWPLTLVPGYPAYPPEMVFPRTPSTEIPVMYVSERGGERGAARLAYFPTDIDRTLWRSFHPDLARLLQNTVRWAAPALPVEVTGPGLVDTFVYETEAGLALHLVNLTNANTFRGPALEILPLRAQQVRWELAAGFRPSRLRLLRSEREIRFTRSGAAIQFTIPEISDYEVAAIVSAEWELSAC